ncbi:hypothetical protein DYH10_03220 [Candidatus Saccharibacteria bacterium CPR2]|nr:hypothetical protein [Candidatus Saccharibacteria bacterium CPR2]
MIADKPNLLLTGQILTGKSTIARALEEQFGYCRINTGEYILNHLANTRPSETEFTPADYRNAREELIALNGLLYFFSDNLPNPLAVDGVRSPAIVKELKKRNFYVINVIATQEERLARSTSRGSPAHTSRLVKHKVDNLAQLLAIDAHDANELDEVKDLTDVRIHNGNNDKIPEICKYIIDQCLILRAI